MSQRSKTFWRNLETATHSVVESKHLEEVRVPGLTILSHSDPHRIGERSALAALASGQESHFSRLEPLFALPGDSLRRPLAEPHLSRQPVRLLPSSTGGIRLVPSSSKIRVEVDGEPVRDSYEVSAQALEQGAVILLAERVTLLLHQLDPIPPEEIPRFGLVGDSTGLMAVRQQIQRVADLEMSALLRGETGTGKELVAMAIHSVSARRERPFVAVNMGAVPASLAASELFGASKGAFTGADRARQGFFTRADGGTLFLDEIGETPAEVQGMLLRALEVGEIQSVGSQKSRKVDVRILAATDAHLEKEIAAGRFRAPLLHRLSGYEIHLPPLRERRDDIGRLLLHFLRQELENLGESWRLEGRGNPKVPWLPAALVARLALCPWPGNVRQLRNVTRQLVVSNRGAPQLRLTPEITAQLEGVSASETGRPGDTSGPLPKLDENFIGEESRPVVKTLMITDLVDSTALVERLGDRRTHLVMSRQDREARRLLVEYDGREIDKSDGFLFLFDRPVDAVAYALEYHETLAALSLELGVELATRVGLHLGEILLRRNTPAEVSRGAKALEVEGVAKAMAARLMSLASGGQTLLSRGAFDLARQASRGDHPLASPEVRWLAHGEYRLQGLREAVEVFEVGVVGTALLKAPEDTTKAKRVTQPNPLPEDLAGVPERDRPERERSERECSEHGHGVTSLEESKVDPPVESKPSYRRPDEVSEEELLAALRTYAFRLQPTAAALNISRTSLYALIKKSPRIKKARDLSAQEIAQAEERCSGDLDKMAAMLEVSRKGLRRRMTELGLE